MIEEESLDFIVSLFHLYFQPLRYIKQIIKILSGKLMPHILEEEQKRWKSQLRF